MNDTATLSERMTFEAAARLDPNTASGELTAGRWVPLAKTTWRHGRIAGNILFLLDTYARTHAGWSVAGCNPGIKLSHDPDTLRGPDVAIVRASHCPTGRGAEGWLEGAPDVVAEIIRDGWSASDAAMRAIEYLAAGAKMVWVLDPDPARVMVYTPPNAIRVLRSDEILDGGDVLPGFSCRVAELFE
jgi:Uma2 family endonuclease